MKKNYTLSQIGNMDETPQWLDMPGGTTVTHTGDRSVPIRTTGMTKVTSLFFLLQWQMERNSSHLLSLKILEEYQRYIEQIVGQLYHTVAMPGQMNEKLTKEWVKKVWRDT